MVLVHVSSLRIFCCEICLAQVTSYCVEQHVGDHSLIICKTLAIEVTSNLLAS